MSSSPPQMAQPPAQQSERPAGRRPYRAPVLSRIGRIEDVTQGAGGAYLDIGISGTMSSG